VFVAFRLLEVRDWRCYGAVLMWPAIWASLGNGSVSLILLCACAGLWRYRARPYVAGCLLALLVVFKLYLWPLGVWLLVTRRVRATVVSIGAAGGAALLGWALIGFAGLREYPSLLGRLTTLVGAESYSPYAFARSLGASAGGARLAMLACGALMLVGVYVSARRGRDETAFIMAIGATFALSPIVWPHYFVLLVVAVAVGSRELDAGWLLPIGAWYATTVWSDGRPIKIGVALAVYGLTMVWAVRRSTGSARPTGLIAPSFLRPAVK
jgi:glycosyl transferase family 87